jgi:hypothetical protein
MGTRLARLEEKEREPTMCRPTRLEDPGQEAHYQGSLKDIQ